MNRGLAWFITVSIFFLALSANGQQASFNQQYYQAERFIETESFSDAIPILEQLLSENPENANLQFKLGYCYLNSSVDKEKSLDLLKKASDKKSKKYNYDSPKETNAPYEIDFFLAQAFFHNHDFIEADKLFKTFKSEMQPYADEEMLAEIDCFIKWNNNAARLVSSPLDVKMVHLPEGINTSDIEYAPVLSGDEQTLIFTSSRARNEAADNDASDDLFISQKEGDSWTAPIRMSNVINTPGHEASASLSFDGFTLVVYVNDNGNGNLYQSQFDGEQWGMPELMGDLINSPSQETHGCFSPDNEQFYFTSDRPGGFGGLDIYVSRKLPSGQWGMPENLGPNINSSFDEETPFMHPDNQRLFFSSCRRESMGGHDIFVSQRSEQGEWSTPENLGYPINSTADDVCFSVSADGKRGYYSSFNEQSFGETDLFMIEMPGEDHTNLLVYVGFAKNEQGEVLPNADISAFDESSGDLFGVYTPNPRSGKFVLAAPAGTKIKLVIEADGYEPIEKHIEIGANLNPNTPDARFATQEIQLESLAMRPVETPKVVIDEQVLMPYNSFETNLETCEPLKELLLTHPKGKVVLTGHTDSKGPEWYNNALSLKRARYLQRFLISNGVAKNRISIAGKGESNPLAKNTIDGADSPEGRAFNRRVTVEISGVDTSLYIINPAIIADYLKIR